MQTALALVIQLFLCVTACAESGVASIYTRAEGKWTASGERMSNHTMTAAHRKLPFGTRVRVHHGADSVIVTINDRGPWKRGRIIDLTPAAASAVHLSGLGYVTLERLK